MKIPRALPQHVVVLGVACALKLWHRHAGAEGLQWLLAPACRLLDLLPGFDFQREAGVGWISHSQRLIVGTDCSGLSFLVIAYLAIYFTAAARVADGAGPWLWIAASFGAAWMLTILSNAGRILLALRLRAAPIDPGLLSPSQLHAAAGVFVYCLVLVIACAAVQRLFDALQRPAAAQAAASVRPIAWYLGVTLLIPLADLAWRDDPGRFLRHAGLVIAVSLTVALLVMLLRSPGAAATRRRKRPAMLESAPGRTPIEEP